VIDEVVAGLALGADGGRGAGRACGGTAQAAGVPTEEVVPGSAGGADLVGEAVGAGIYAGLAAAVGREEGAVPAGLAGLLIDALGAALGAGQAGAFLAAEEGPREAAQAIGAVARKAVLGEAGAGQAGAVSAEVS
jgi:hypothetical protein